MDIKDDKDLSFENLELLPIKTIEKVEDVCIHIVDSEGKIICYSQGCEIIEDMKRKDVINKKIEDLYDFVDCDSNQLKVLKTGEKIVNAHVKYISPSGKVADVISSTYPSFSKENPHLVEASISIFRDIPDYMNIANTIAKIQKDIKKGYAKNNGTQFTFCDIVGSSKEITKVIEECKAAANTNAPVLIYGDTGTGKEVFAQSIHNAGHHPDSPFISIPCGSIPENIFDSILFGTEQEAFPDALDSTGLIDSAKDGTLFLEEINAMPLVLQSKLLRVLETGKYRKVGGFLEYPIEFRVISTLNQDPYKAILENRLRQDLFYYLSIFSIKLPPLCQRKKDIIELVFHFLSTLGISLGKRLYMISPEAKSILLSHPWPGNILELKHAISYAIHMSDYQNTILTPELLPGELRKNEVDLASIEKYFNISEKDHSLKDIMNKMEHDVILEVLKSNDFNVSKSARDLGMLRQNLQYKIKVHGIIK